MKPNNIPIPITDKLIKLTRALLGIMATVETLHPMVNGYKKAILQEIGAINKETGEPVTDPKCTYLISDEQFKIYSKRCDKEAAKLCLSHKPDFCPLQEAETLERETKRAFVTHILPFFPSFEGVTYDDMCEFAEYKNGKYVTDKLGRTLFDYDVFIGNTLDLIIPLIDPKELDFNNIKSWIRK